MALRRAPPFWQWQELLRRDTNARKLPYRSPF
jgi:hypothetical protein